MNIIAVDDERAALWAVERAVKKAAPEASVACFRAAGEALDYAKESKVDAAFLDIEMNEMNGLLLAKKLKDICGDTNIIFVTGYTDYLKSAFDMHASGYVVKPVDDANIAKELDDLRKPVKHSAKGIRVQCFGSFAVFVDGELLTFKRSKAKELLAFLVHKNGAGVSNAEIAAALWEDKPYNDSVQSQTRKACSHLIQILKEAGIAHIIRKDWNSISVDVDKISCDYHEFLKKNAAAVNSYTGEYMSEYAWAEFTIGFLNSKI